jgi:hypothetical protein
MHAAAVARHNLKRAASQFLNVVAPGPSAGLLGRPCCDGAQVSQTRGKTATAVAGLRRYHRVLRYFGERRNAQRSPAQVFPRSIASANGAQNRSAELPKVALRQRVFTTPFQRRAPLAFDGKLLGAVKRLLTPLRHCLATGCRGLREESGKVVSRLVEKRQIPAHDDRPSTSPSGSRLSLPTTGTPQAAASTNIRQTAPAIRVCSGSERTASPSR